MTQDAKSPRRGDEGARSSLQEVYLPLNPAEQGADLLAGDLDGVAVDGVALLEESSIVVAVVVLELLGELAYFDADRARLDTPELSASWRRTMWPWFWGAYMMALKSSGALLHPYRKTPQVPRVQEAPGDSLLRGAAFAPRIQVVMSAWVSMFLISIEYTLAYGYTLGKGGEGSLDEGSRYG